MMIKKLCVAFLLTTVALVNAGEVKKVKATQESLPDIEQYLTPFWLSDSSYQEPLFFVQGQDGEPASARLLFPPGKILSFTSATGEIVFEEGKDYQIEAVSGIITLPLGSRIPFKTRRELYPLNTDPNPKPNTKINQKKGEPQTLLLFSEGTFFRSLQVAVTYTHGPGLWTGYTPAFMGRHLPKTLGKLQAQQPVTISVSGDSISAGWGSSGPPHRYANLVKAGLERAYGATITLNNRAHGGWTAPQGLKDAALLAAQKPDLVLIAYGMNDIKYNDVATYSGNIQRIMAEIRTLSPETEFILVSSMLGNPEWEGMPGEDKFTKFRDALAGLCGPGVVLADVTAAWMELLKRKSLYDLTGNGLNHPNDFSHRIYAQVILGLLLKKSEYKDGRICP